MAFTYAVSKVISLSPFFTACPSFTNTVKPLPFRLTVSMPICSMYSLPSFVVRPMACFVSKTKFTVLSAGANTSPSAGCTIKPSPFIFSANASSGVSVIEQSVPVKGLANVSFFFPNNEPNMLRPRFHRNRCASRLNTMLMTIQLTQGK